MLLKIILNAGLLISFYNLQAQPKKFSYSASKMGSPFNIILYSTDSLLANRAANDAYKMVDSLVYIFSDYIDSSELNRLCVRAGQDQAFIASPALFDILEISVDASRKSQGSFDITLGALTRLWRRARKEKIWPSENQVQQALAVSGYKKIKLDKATRSVWLTQKGMLLDLGGIAQGYIAQKVIDSLRSMGISSALVNVSGDIVTLGSPPGKNGWTLALGLPESREKVLERTISVSGKAVTTSGNAFQFMIHEGKKYSHVLDPQTGYGLTSGRTVTVIADDGIKADWLTKAFSQLSFSSARKLAREQNAEFIISEYRNEKIRKRLSRGFASFWTTVK